MTKQVSIEAQWMWFVLFSVTEGILEEPVEDYSGLLDGMEAAELLALLEKVQARLKQLGRGGESRIEKASPVKLYIDKKYHVHMGSPDGPVLPLRPLVKTLFILFLRHPEGIVLKQRDKYRKEMEEIYAVISPNTALEDIQSRIGRLVDLQDNSFSEKASVLNARLDQLLPAAVSQEYKIQGYIGQPRRIPLNPLMVNWL